MKRTRMTAVVTAMLACLSLTACSGSNDEPDNAREGASTAPASTNSAAPSKTPDEITAPKPFVFMDESPTPGEAPSGSLLVGFQVSGSYGTIVCDIFSVKDDEVSFVGRYDAAKSVGGETSVTYCSDPYFTAPDGSFRVSIDEASDKLFVVSEDGTAKQVGSGIQSVPTINPDNGRVYYWARDGFTYTLRSVNADGTNDKAEKYNEALVTKPGDRFGFLAGEPVGWNMLYNEHGSLKATAASDASKTTAYSIDGKLHVGPLAAMTTNPAYTFVSDDFEAGSYSKLNLQPKVMVDENTVIGTYGEQIVRGEIDHDKKQIKLVKVSDDLNKTMRLLPNYVNGHGNRQSPSAQQMWMRDGKVIFTLVTKAKHPDYITQTHVVSVDLESGKTRIDAALQYADGKDKVRSNGEGIGLND